MKNPVTESRNSNHFHGAFSYLQKRNSKEIPSKLDSVNLLYDRDQNETNNVKPNGSSKEEKRSESNLLPRIVIKLSSREYFIASRYIFRLQPGRARL